MADFRMVQDSNGFLCALDHFSFYGAFRRAADGETNIGGNTAGGKKENISIQVFEGGNGNLVKKRTGVMIVIPSGQVKVDAVVLRQIDRGCKGIGDNIEGYLGFTQFTGNFHGSGAGIQGDGTPGRNDILNNIISNFCLIYLIGGFPCGNIVSVCDRIQKHGSAKSPF